MRNVSRATLATMLPGSSISRSVKGIVRGAMEIDTYALRETPIEPTFVWNSPNTLDDWRKMGFFSVIEGGRDSILGKMLALGHVNPVEPNAQFPADIKIDQLERKNHLPNKYEIDGYVAQFPNQGMPLAVSGLTDEEYEKTMSWLEAGAPIDYEAPKPTAKELRRFGNGRISSTLMISVPSSLRGISLSTSCISTSFLRIGPMQTPSSSFVRPRQVVKTRFRCTSILPTKRSMASSTIGSSFWS